ncbi:MAG: hypothetical protein HYX25_06920, partial [Candidatus Solibacter usitatus]|nr:hypothetical protein [Candidatus Solibacter usitatus]
IEDGAVAPWSSSSVPSPYYLQALKGVLAHYGAKIDVPVLHGCGSSTGAALPKSSRS